MVCLLISELAFWICLFLSASFHCLILSLAGLFPSNLWFPPYPLCFFFFFLFLAVPKLPWANNLHHQDKGLAHSRWSVIHVFVNKSKIKIKWFCESAWAWAWVWFQAWAWILGFWKIWLVSTSPQWWKTSNRSLVKLASSPCDYIFYFWVLS